MAKGMLVEEGTLVKSGKRTKLPKFAGKLLKRLDEAVQAGGDHTFAGKRAEVKVFLHLHKSPERYQYTSSELVAFHNKFRGFDADVKAHFAKSEFYNKKVE